MRKTFLAVGLVTMIAAAASPAAAATIGFNICNDPALSLCDQLTMTTTLDGGAIDVHVSAPSGYGIFGDEGHNLAFGFNVVGSTEGLTVTGLTSGFTLGDFPDGESMNGYGLFEYLIEGPHTGSGSTLPLDFTVSRTGGFTSDLSLFEVNSTGYIVAAHLRNERTGLTGFVAADGEPDGGNTPVPEPTTMILLGTGLVAAFRARKL